MLCSIARMVLLSGMPCSTSSTFTTAGAVSSLPGPAVTGRLRAPFEQEEDLVGGLPDPGDLTTGLVTNFLAALGDAKELVDRERGEHWRSS